MKHSGFTVALCLALGACASAPKQAPISDEEAYTRVGGWENAYESGDNEALIRHYHPNATTTAGTVARTKSEYAKHFARSTARSLVFDGCEKKDTAARSSVVCNYDLEVSRTEEVSSTVPTVSVTGVMLFEFASDTRIALHLNTEVASHVTAVLDKKARKTYSVPDYLASRREYYLGFDDRERASIRWSAFWDAADAVTTGACLAGIPGATELNPVANFFIKRLGGWAGVVVFKAGGFLVKRAIVKRNRAQGYDSSGKVGKAFEAFPSVWNTIMCGLF